MTDVVIGVPRRFDVRGLPTIAAKIDIDDRSFDIYFRASEGPLTQTSDPFLAVALLPAMHLGAALKVEGTVSADLLVHLEHIQEIYSSWYSTLHKVPVQATPVAVAPAQTSSGAFFSGGIDSFYTALKHQKTLDRLIFVHGLDISVNDAPLHTMIAAKISEAATELGITLLKVETNQRRLLDVYAGWNKNSHGAALAAVALALSPQLRRIYIGATHPYNVMMPHGSNPVLDPLWGNGQVELIHDGGESERWQKLEISAATRPYAAPYAPVGRTVRDAIIAASAPVACAPWPCCACWD